MTSLCESVKYEAEARELWATCVPASGQADTVQGELLRAVEKLRDESVRNGNVNWDEGHAELARFIHTILLSSGIFGPGEVVEIEQDLNRALDVDHPADDDLYDRLADRVVEWSHAHPTPVPHQRNPQLRR